MGRAEERRGKKELKGGEGGGKRMGGEESLGFFFKCPSTGPNRAAMVSGPRKQCFSLQRDTPLSFIIFP